MSAARTRSKAVLRSVTGVFSGVATTALCLSVAASALGGLPHAAAAATRTASPSQAPCRSPHPAPHDHGRRIFSAKLDATGVGPTAEKNPAAQQAAGTAAGFDPRAGLTSAALSGEGPGSSLLKSCSKCSRTRGQPDAA